MVAKKDEALPENVEDKKKVLDAVIKKIEKQFGKGAIMTLGSNAVKEVETIPSGCLSLDIAIGVGGLPRGRVIEIYGPESSGKTTFTLGAIASCQKLGETAAFIDAEHAFDPKYARKLGVDTDSLLVSQPDCGEQALEIVNELVQSGSVSLIVVDSVAALVPRSELDGDMEQQQMGVQARMMSKILRKVTGVASKTGCIVIFINQIRMKIGVMFGNPETTTGGNALKFYSSVRIEIRKGKLINKGDVAIGAETKIKIVKNKVAAPFKEAVVDMIFGEGIQRLGELINLAEAAGIIDKAGSWYSYGSERIGQGKENVRDYLKNNPKIADEIEAKVREAAQVVEIEIGKDEKEESESEE